MALSDWLSALCADLLLVTLSLTCWQTLALLAFVIVGAEIIRVGKILVTVAS